MPLDPEIKTIVDAWNRSGIPGFNTMTPQEARRTHAQLERPPSAISLPSVRDRHIPGPGGDLRVRIYRPEGEAPLPALVYFHGGGWVMGSIETIDARCRALAQGADCVVISPDYRLAPEDPYPAAAEDCFEVTKWVVASSAGLGVDPDRVAVGGDSAGGNLAAVVALMSRDRGGPKLRFQLLVYPTTSNRSDFPSHIENATGYLLTTAEVRWYLDQYAPDTSSREEPYCAPLLAQRLRGLPPAMVITAEYDPLRDEGEAYAHRLQEDGVPTYLRRYDGLVHGFFGMGEVSQRARAAVDDACAALREAYR